MYKVIFVDIDNTLLDFDEYVRQTMKTGFDHFGLKPYEPWMYDIFKRENDKLWCQIEEATLTFEELQKIRWNIIFELIGIDFDGPTFETYFREALFDSAIPVPGSYELLEGLTKKGYILCAASNGPSYQQHRRLGIADMSKYFSHIVISEDCGISKPAKGFFDYCFEEINRTADCEIKPQECLIIGDSMTSDMAGGMNCGMKTCFYRRNPSKAVPEGMLDYVVDDLREILKFV